MKKNEEILRKISFDFFSKKNKINAFICISSLKKKETHAFVSTIKKNPHRL